MSKEKEKWLKQERKGDLNLFWFFILLIFVVSLRSGAFAQDLITPDKLSKLEEIEEKLFHEKYKNDSAESRISRIESFIFGTSKKDFDINSRLNYILSSLEKKVKLKPKIYTSEHKVIKPEPIVIEKETSDTDSSILGQVKKMEEEVFGDSFEEKSFNIRVEELEARLLSDFERIQSKQKALLDRVSYLVKKFNNTKNRISNIQQRLQNPIQHREIEQTYTLDPLTGLVINESTGEVAKDEFGNPIKVRLPSQIYPNNPAFPTQPNPLFPNAPYGTGQPSLQPQQLPPEFFLQQNGFDFGDDGFGY